MTSKWFNLCRYAEAKCDQLLDFAAQLVAAAAAGDTATLRPLISSADIGLLAGAAVGKYCLINRSICHVKPFYLSSETVLPIK
jgi:hypothetical protein